MRPSIRLENPRPVELVPLAELPYGEGDPVYIGRRQMEPGCPDGHPDDVGWVVIDGEYPFHLVNGRVVHDFHDFDQFRTRARVLQPGERLVVTWAANAARGGEL